MYLGASGSGKTHLQEQLALLVPREDRIEATGLSDQSLYYEGLKLKGKILFIEDLDGAENVMYIIRELQSKGRITKRVAWRDNKGNTKTVEIEAQGPVVISSCTTPRKTLRGQRQPLYPAACRSKPGSGSENHGLHEIQECRQYPGIQAGRNPPEDAERATRITAGEGLQPLCPPDRAAPGSV